MNLTEQVQKATRAELYSRNWTHEKLADVIGDVEARTISRWLSSGNMRAGWIESIAKAFGWTIRNPMMRGRGLLDPQTAPAPAE